MQNQNQKTILSLLLVQFAISIFYTYGLVQILLERIAFLGYGAALEPLMLYGPHLIILLASLCPQAVLLLRHKLHSQDGEILPPLFTMVATQSSMIVADAVSASGYIFVFPEALAIVERFSLMGTAALFLLSSLRYFGFSSSRLPGITAVFITIPFLVSALLPVSSYMGKVDIMAPGYEVYTQIIVAAIYALTIITFTIMAFKDGTSLNLKRALSFILLIAGIYLAHFDDVYTSAVSAVLYISGTVILCITAGDSL